MVHVTRPIEKRPEASRHEPFPVSSYSGDACESIRTEEDGNKAASSGYRSNTPALQSVPLQREWRQQWRRNFHHARPEFGAEPLLCSYTNFVFHARSRHFRGPHADQHYVKKTQVWRTNSSWQQEVAENNSELF